MKVSRLELSPMSSPMPFLSSNDPDHVAIELRRPAGYNQPPRPQPPMSVDTVPSPTSHESSEYHNSDVEALLREGKVTSRGMNASRRLRTSGTDNKTWAGAWSDFFESLCCFDRCCDRMCDRCCDRQALRARKTSGSFC